MSILSALVIAILNPSEQFKKANDSRKKSDLSQVAKALEGYYEDNGSYPLSSAGKIVDQGAAKEWGDSWQPYMNLLPKPPSGGYYYVSAGGDSYYLYAHLERKDPSLCTPNKPGVACPGVPGQQDFLMVCGGIKCNYGISSPNVSP
ncbi:type IV pilin protein [Patescibacteria group bacterium]|nr:type IV pilin protein [Patescibacteria group bacterium]